MTSSLIEYDLLLKMTHVISNLYVFLTIKQQQFLQIYINQLHSPMQAQNMIKDNSQDFDKHFHQFMTSGVSIDHQYSWMDQYFNQNVLEPKFILEPTLTAIFQQQTDLILVDELETPPILDRPKNKSIFHNFQKHLLTLLKKIIIIRKSQLSLLPYGNRAFDLWKIFMTLSFSSKKNLYIIFGVAQQQNEANLRSVAQNLPQLQKLLSKYDIKQVELGQQLLRRIVSQQAAAVEKENLQKECKMKKFEEFYCYFTGFIEQLMQGAISRRLTKQRKLRLIKSQRSQE